MNMIAYTADEYRASVARALTGADEALVFNGTIDHARVVIEEAFKAAKSHVRILTNKLDPTCYGSRDVIDAALAFLRAPGARLDILVEDETAPVLTQDFLMAVTEAGGARVRANVVPAMYVEDYDFNFLTVDDVAYRFESDRTKPIAVVAGGASARSTVDRLTNIFDRLFDTGNEEALRLTA
jgi:hypothetical protein